MTGGPQTEQARPEPFDAVEVIRVKRDGGRLGDEQIDWVVDAYTRGAVADEQMSALADGDPAARAWSRPSWPAGPGP